VTSDAPGSGAAPAAAEGREVLRDRFADEVVLLTGFPGFRARALVRTLVEREPNACFWFVVPSEIEAAARVLAAHPLAPEQLRLIPGEPCAIDLGLSRQVYAELAKRVDRWFALYQTTDSLAPRDLCFRVNLGHAREIVELSRVAESLTHVTFLSNGAVFGDHPREAAEEDLTLGQSFRGGAAESLALAEAVLRRRLAEVPLSVVRTPQVLAARGGAGAAVRPSGLHRLLLHVASAPSDGALPLPPGSHRPVQVVPADFVADALYAVAALGTRGRTYHFAEAAPPSLAEVLEQAARHFGKRFEQGFDPRTLGRLLLKNPGFWLSQQSSRALSEWADGPQLLTRGGDRLLDRAALRVPPLLEYLDVVLKETDELLSQRRLDDARPSQPFEAVA